MSDSSPVAGPAAAIGLEMDELGAERATGTVPVTGAVLQPYGIVHGGVYSLIAESLTSAATDAAVRGDGMTAMGLTNSASFLRPISTGTIHATATRRHAGRTTWIWDCEMNDDEDRLCALVRITIAIRPRPG